MAQRVDDLRENLLTSTQRALQSRQQAQAHLKARLAAHHPSREIERRRSHLAHLAARLRVLGPQGTLDRGYALVLDPQGHPLAQAAKAKEGQSVRIVLSKGIVGASVTGVEPSRTLIDALRPPTVGATEPAPTKAKPPRKARKSPPPTASS
jgi:exodeoxyribonuclease VII large subunit